MRRAFTLMEVLAVITVMALLMAIMLPAMARSRRYAQGTISFANLGSLSHTMSWYLNDHRESYLNPFRQEWPKTGPYAGMTWTMACSDRDPVTQRWDFAHPTCPELHTEGFSKVWYSYLAEYRGGHRADREQISPADRDLVSDYRAKSSATGARSDSVLMQTSYWYSPPFWLSPAWYSPCHTGKACSLGTAHHLAIRYPAAKVVLWERTDYQTGAKPLAWNDPRAHTNVAMADASCQTVSMDSLYQAVSLKKNWELVPLESRCTLPQRGFKTFFLHTRNGINGKDLPL